MTIQGTLDFLRKYKFARLSCENDDLIDIEAYITPKRVWWARPVPDVEYAPVTPQGAYQDLINADSHLEPTPLADLVDSLGDSYSVHSLMDRDGITYWRFVAENDSRNNVFASLILSIFFSRPANIHA